MSVRVITGDCLEVMSGMEANSVDAIVTDPPAGISFMGKTWDHDKGGRDHWIAWMQTVAAECLRVLKPGGHALVWALPRTSHWTATAWENAGFTVRDRCIHIFSQGFPKSLDVSKAIDKAAGVEGMFGPPKSEAHSGWIDRGRMRGNDGNKGYQRPWMDDAAAVDRNARQYVGGTDAARQWQGWGTALKPAAEDFWLLRKPFPNGYTVAQNVLEFGTGGLNIDATRVVTTDNLNGGAYSGGDKDLGAATSFATGVHAGTFTQPPGRWPANVITDGSDEVLAAFPDGSFNRPIERKSDAPIGLYEGHIGKATAGSIRSAFGDTGSAARFFHNTREGESRVFYTAKASSFDRNDGTYDLPKQVVSVWGGEEDDLSAGKKSTKPRGNHHPTVKPTELMRWLCRLITPPVVVDLVCSNCDNPSSEVTRRQEDDAVQAVRSGVLESPQDGDLLLERLSRGQPDSAAHELPSVRPTGRPSAEDSLFAAVRECGADEAEDTVPAPLRAMPNDLSADERRSEAFLLQGLCGGQEWPGSAQGKAVYTPGIRSTVPAGASDGDEVRVCHGASATDGRTDRAASDAARCRSPHQRGEVGQPIAKPNADDEARPRHPAEAGDDPKTDRLPTLSRKDSAQQSCPKCGCGLTRIERPGVVLDPFCGSGSTLKAAEIEGFSAIGIELDPAYVEIARRRIASDIPLFAEIAALTEEALLNNAGETLWCSPHCVPERVSQFDLFAEITAA